MAEWLKRVIADTDRQFALIPKWQKSLTQFLAPADDSPIPVPTPEV